MGIPWIFELISVIVDESTGFWYVCITLTSPQIVVKQ